MDVVDLNADLGERPLARAEDARIMGAVTSANIACGGHAGDADSMRWCCEQAARHRVQIGAHISYVDAENFGRLDIDPEPPRLLDQLATQINDLNEIARATGLTLAYVKPHGALYNRAAADPDRARTIIAAITLTGLPLKVLALPNSALADAARAANLTPIAEGFADRAYNPDGTLVPRSRPGSILGRDDALHQVLCLALTGAVTTITGAEIELEIQSICLHSDNPGAADLADGLRIGLEAAGFRVEPFA